MQADEVGQGMDRGQALVLRRRATAPALSQIPQEGPHSIHREFLDTQPVDPSAAAAGGERQQLTQGVAVALLRVRGEIPLADEVFQQERAGPRGPASRCQSWRPSLAA